MTVIVSGGKVVGGGSGVFSTGSGSSGFTPDSGFTFTGTPAFDSSFTINVSDSRFGTTGPTLVMFDDFRNGTAGQLIPDGAPAVLGPATWDDNPGDRTGVLWAAGNRSGSGQCFRWLNNTGSTNYTHKIINMSSAVDVNQFYIFYAETSRGSWNYQASASYYKHNWALISGAAGFTAGAFNTCMPTFADTSSSYFVGNDDPPLPQWNNGLSSSHWSTNNWNSVELAYVGDAASPTSNAGLQYISLYNSDVVGGRLAASNSAQVLFSNTTGSNGTYAAAKLISFPAFIQNVVGSITMDRADVYLTKGVNCLKRFFIGDASTLAACTTIMPCTVDSWAAGAVGFTPRQGAFSSLSGKFLYGCWDPTGGAINRVGQFT